MAKSRIKTIGFTVCLIAALVFVFSSCSKEKMTYKKLQEHGIGQAIPPVDGPSMNMKAGVGGICILTNLEPLTN